ncbi:MAG: DUF1559 domain-containing protein [Pirellulaceae bacterium]
MVEANTSDGKVDPINNVKVFFSFLLIGAALALVVGFFLRIDEIASADSKSEVSDKLQQIGLAFHAFHQTNGALAFPRVMDVKVMNPNKRPRPTELSWRVHLLPFIQQRALYEKFHLDEPWDSPHNLPLADSMPEVYRLAGTAENETRFRVLCGPGMLFGQTTAPRLRDCPDGLRHTILSVLVGSDAATLWTKPDDIVIDPKNPLAALGTNPNSFIACVMGDAKLLLLPTDVEASEFLAFATPSGGEVVDADRYRRSP